MLRFIFILFLAICAALPLGAQISKTEFASEMIEILKEDPLLAGSQITFIPENDEILVEDANRDIDQRIYLPNLYNKFKDLSKSERREGIKNFLAFTKEQDVSTEELKASLKLRLRTKSEISSNNILFNPLNDKPYRTTYELDDWIIEIVYDSDEAVRGVAPEEFAENNISRELAREIALENTKTTLPFATWEKEGKVYYSATWDDFDSARLVLFGDASRLPLEGDILAYFPSHSLAVATQDIQPQTIKEMLEIGDELSVDHRPLSYDVWHRQNGNWTIYAPAADHPTYSIIAERRIGVRKYEYDEQAETLYTANPDKEGFGLAPFIGIEYDKDARKFVGVTNFYI